MSIRCCQKLGVEEGAVAVTASVLLSMLILLTAVVVDIGLLRMDERESQLAADMAASAALLPVDEFDPFAPGAAHDACENAWEYIVANVEGINAAAAVEDPSGLPPCSIFGSAVVCNAAAPVPVTSRIVAPPYTVEITSPVLNFGQGHAISDELMRQNDVMSGEPCERVGVRVERDREYILAGIAGFGSGSSRPSAVSMWQPGARDDFASLIVLEQHDCFGIRVQGGAHGGGVEVSNFDPGTPGDPSDDILGEITVDSDGHGPSCGPSQPYTIEVGGMTNGYAYAEGAINSKALDVGNVARAYEPADLTTPQTDSPAGFKLAVTPTAGTRELRTSVDHPLNCLTNAEYYSGQPWSPTHGTEQVDDCTGPDAEYVITGPPVVTVDRPPFVRRMHERLAPVVPGDSGWTVFPDDFPGESCSSAEENIDEADTITDEGNPIATGAVGEYLIINCPASNGPSTFSPDAISITGVRIILSVNRINLGSSSSLTIDGHDSAGTLLYLQEGDISKVAAAVMNVTDTFTYLDSQSSGFVDLGAQAVPLTWKGPLTDSSTRATLKAECDDYVDDHPASTTPPMSVVGVPPAACFGPATLWSNGLQDHGIGGQSSLQIAGTFFAPNAKFDFDGAGDQNLDAAQFFARFLWLTGQGSIGLTPNPDTNFKTSSPTSGLIR